MQFSSTQPSPDHFALAKDPKVILFILFSAVHYLSVLLFITRWIVLMQTHTHAVYLTNRFHFSVRVFTVVDRRWTSQLVTNKKERHETKSRVAWLLFFTRCDVFVEYCDSVWTCCGEQNKERLEKLQRRAARTITRFVRSDEAMNSLRWDTLETRRDMHVFKLVNKCITGKSPQFFNNYFIFNRDILSRSTRQSNKLHLPKVRTEWAKNSFYYHGCKVFNKLK